LAAPFDGTVSALYTKAGDVVSAGTQAIQIADLGQMYVDVPISEVDIPSVKVDQSVDLVFDAYFEQTFKGKVVEVADVGDARTGVVSYQTTIALEDGQGLIKPGMTAGVTILTEERQNVFTVPSQALTTYQGKDAVYVCVTICQCRWRSPWAAILTINTKSPKRISKKVSQSSSIRPAACSI